MKHGGDLLSYQHLYEGELLDFSSNINPLGPPKGLKEVFVNAFKDIEVYPDIQYRKLTRAVATYLGCKPVEVVVGNGATEIIHNISILFDRVIVPVPSFAEYMQRPIILGKQVVEVPFGENLALDVDAVIANIQPKDLVIVGNPNNPTGKRIEREKLTKLYAEVVKRDAFLLLDEAFYEFCPQHYDSIRLFEGSEHVGIIRAATKFFALPGVRLGYAHMSVKNADKYRKIALPWSVNAFADAAGSMIFRDAQYIVDTRTYVAQQREKMLEALKDIPEIHAFPSDCNYILIKLRYDTQEELFHAMIKKGIFIRKAASFIGLDNTYIRIAVKDEKSNAYLIKCFKSYFENKLGVTHEKYHDYRT